MLAVGERTNANGSQEVPRRDARRPTGTTCVEMAREQIREGAHLLDVCVDYVGRDGVADMDEIAGRFATASTLPLVLDSTEPPVIEAGLEQLGGRASSTRSTSRTATGPSRRFAAVMPLAQRARRRA